ncbi:hypothetical protein DE146DRAFT_749832 [Phaeosphaeria sp. MPI-PUGE-AT-0046c]|nr:hypothetical protein DE146DRAFT_749832 [Phaeosphaeria sp. MPI-PUGE-AT-0046c]
MPSTSPRPPQQMTPERIRSGIIVSVVVGTLATLILAYVVLRWRRNRGIKAGSVEGRHANGRRREDEKDLEVGVIQEPVPAYTKDLSTELSKLGTDLAEVSAKLAEAAATLQQEAANIAEELSKQWGVDVSVKVGVRPGGGRRDVNVSQ